MQESKRSANDLSGRTDGNTKVIFPKEEVAVQSAESNRAPISAGDYVLVEILSANSQSLRGRALSHSSLRETVKNYDEHVSSNTTMTETGP
ncbi:CDK5 regulatory subunit-associated protein 1-like [Notothenia coriiceps]|uniref:CDK5 regulatory subunit-associated protein 1-like n=1 Tax=Notothenia coriiceps TaxID=8208 RepID=A0A6I9PBT5_9TELE|nr:PREDICTED: CDK5 regulatory subunit-associated protein 1-like [Notothenia coriiceps]